MDNQEIESRITELDTEIVLVGDPGQKKAGEVFGLATELEGRTGEPVQSILARLTLYTVAA